jgi:BlaI family transcriptional regulator, penicillinase repressor
MNTGVEMIQPKGTLTSDQIEIMNVLWQSGKPLTAAEIWQELSASRRVARTTVVTLVKRLAKRGWVSQEGEARGATYQPACAESEATGRVSEDFLARFFGGSPSRFVMNLVGSGSLSEVEVAKLKAVLAEYEEEKKR